MNNPLRSRAREMRGISLWVGTINSDNKKVRPLWDELVVGVEIHHFPFCVSRISVRMMMTIAPIMAYAKIVQPM